MWKDGTGSPLYGAVQRHKLVDHPGNVGNMRAPIVRLDPRAYPSIGAHRKDAASPRPRALAAAEEVSHAAIDGRAVDEEFIGEADDEVMVPSLYRQLEYSTRERKPMAVVETHPRHAGVFVALHGILQLDDTRRVRVRREKNGVDHAPLRRILRFSAHLLVMGPVLNACIRFVRRGLRPAAT
jgi:hypothetical protein